MPNSLSSILKDPQAFEQLMQEVDAELRTSDVRIQARSMAAMQLISRKLNCAFSWNGDEAKAVSNWFTQTYGDKLKINFDVGKTVVQVQGDVYSVKIPRVFGSVNVNVLEWIEKATPKLLFSLSEQDLDVIGKQIFSHAQAYMEMERLPADCTVDLATSVEHLIDQRPQYGLSRWASLQASEKTLKAYIRVKGGTPPTVGRSAHNLSTLATIAEQLGLPLINRELLASAQCDAGVRYEETLSLKKEAVNGYLASVEICTHIAAHYPLR